VEYRSLGKSGLQVSLAGLGTNNFGRRLDAAATATVVNKAIDLGVNFIDTADVYGDHKSEEFIGRAIKDHRRDLVIGTKFTQPMGEGPLWRGASRRYVMEAVHGSMQRLGIDYIDLYQIHFPDSATPLEETLRALDDLVRNGDVRYVGCSNFAAWQLVEAAWITKTEHLNPLVSVQNQYSLLNRELEREVAPIATKYGAGVIPYSPLAGGFLTGKYRQGEAGPEGARLTGGQGNGARMMTDENYARVATLAAFADEHDHTAGELAMAWLAAQPFVSSVIAGATKPEQVEENVRAIEWKLTPDDLQAIDAIVPPPARPRGQ
jgi:aryl-alcohol dehydrogenase-like predicted oxidoreductase